jgi:hypothetical protein
MAAAAMPATAAATAFAATATAAAAANATAAATATSTTAPKCPSAVGTQQNHHGCYGGDQEEIAHLKLLH